MARIKGSVRRSQLITTYGVGAVVAVDEESFMVAGIDRWPVTDANIIHEPRLERELNVGGFAIPPATEHNPDIPVVRFPATYSCPDCNRLADYRWLTSGDKSECNDCGTPLVPSRFVICCDRGHIDEFPYFKWLHGGQEPTGTTKTHNMRIEAAGKTASLRDIVLSCDCGAQPTTLEDAFGRLALKQVGVRCAGRRPWLGSAAETCDEVPRALQRGASNVWYPVVRSALSIPPWSEGAYKTINRWWHVLQHIPEAALVPTMLGMKIAADTAYSIEDLALAVMQRRRNESGGGVPTASLKVQEYEALCKGKPDLSRTQDFVCEPATVDSLIASWFPRVMLVKRLREVRALEAFTRVLPWTPGDRAERRASLFDVHPGWLPALEVNGEGVFLQLDDVRLSEWEARPGVIARAARLDVNYRRRFGDAEPDRVVSPRLVMIHTLAHVLINQWSLDSGYPAASLRERLYVSDSMAALMIYTATTDSAGSLGGVVGQAEPHRLGPMLRDAIRGAAWCSSDPLCIEAEASGVDALNLAACHACVLLPETSCEEMNLLLDRATLIGTADDPTLGFFATLFGNG